MALRFKPDAGVLAHFSGRCRTAGAEGPAVWVSNGTSISPVSVKPGASDGTFTEILSGALAEGALLVTRATSESSSPTSAAAAGGAGNPLMPAARRRGGG